MQSISINPYLGLQNKNFIDQNQNIEYLVEQMLTKNDDIEEQLIIANQCINLIEKFHSYFHFEQSYFHLLLAKNTLDHNLSLQELKNAIFQDPLNYEAKILITNLLPKDSIELYDHRYNGVVQNIPYTRTITSYENYLKFAIGDKVRVDFDIPQTSHWFYLLFEPKELQKIVNALVICHQSYHTEAAKLYYNRYLIFDALKRQSNDIKYDFFAKNDLIKVKNLNQNILNDVIV